jgi:hypothetical protein
MERANPSNWTQSHTRINHVTHVTCHSTVIGTVRPVAKE